MEIPRIESVLRIALATSSIAKAKRAGDRGQPCHMPWFIWIESEEKC